MTVAHVLLALGELAAFYIVVWVVVQGMWSLTCMVLDRSDEEY